MGQGDVPTSRGGPFRRRKEKRQLEHLAASSTRDGAPRAAAAHVKVLGDGSAAEPQEREQQDRETPEPEVTPAADPPPRPIGFHVRAVPIDQPVGD
jgi:hypothetical protein